MQNFANGRLPTFDDGLVQELVDKLTTLASRGGGRGMRVSFDWLADALGPRLARAVLKRAGFRRLPEQWAVGRGTSIPADYTFPEVFAEELEDILYDHA
ncbi:hypothetical protein ABIE58_003528 [Roseovarius sp. MBR-78]|jgi:hypothetical protein|uniref:hypothetical protein n=1 Tax=Roseovarius sp. MBR-78 TaxID=3156460 RepID=UPI003391A59F